MALYLYKPKVPLPKDGRVVPKIEIGLLVLDNFFVKLSVYFYSFALSPLEEGCFTFI
jgi:hypothetical protein